MTLSLHIGSDHAGYEAKEGLKQWLEEYFPEVEYCDYGAHSEDSVDYPDIAHAVSQGVQEQPESLGLLLCGTGLGMSYSANRHRGIRAALVHDVTTARLAREHNDANILCMGARVLGQSVMQDCLEAFLQTDFSGGRHQRRVEKIEPHPHEGQ